MLKIYGLKLSSRSNKVLMCANALELDYEFIKIDVTKGDNRAPKYLALHPAGKIPVIDHDGFILFESNAIIKYLCKKYDSDLYPNTIEEQAKVDQWCDFIAQHIDINFIRVLFNKVVAPQLGFEVDDRSLEDGKIFIARFLPVVEGQLEKTKYLATDTFSIADICLLASIDSAEMIEVNLEQYPKLNSWREALRSKDFYQKIHKYFGEAILP